MSVTSDYVLTISNTTYDLRKVSSYISDAGAALAYVRFIDMPTVSVALPLTDFEIAYQRSLNAVSGSGQSHYLISAASTNATSVKASPGTVQMLIVANNAGTGSYFKLYNKASAPTVGVDTPTITMLVPPGDNAQLINVSCSTGIAYALTKLIAPTDTTAVGAGEMTVSMIYA